MITINHLNHSLYQVTLYIRLFFLINMINYIQAVGIYTAAHKYIFFLDFEKIILNVHTYTIIVFSIIRYSVVSIKQNKSSLFIVFILL